MLFNQDFESRLIAPRLAGRLSAPVVMNALGVAVSGAETTVTASAFGGDTHAEYRLTGPLPHIVAVMPNAVVPESVASPTNPAIEQFPADLSAVTERIRVVTPARTEGARLEDAQVIVAGGRGLGSPSNFRLIEELAEAVGGMPAASRPLVDDGWTEASRQVGLTGRITRPALYMALGISGASQHMAGCSAAKTIVAVNRDPDAAIFRYAKYGIVGDCLEIIPELIAAVSEA
jgi:electron transfer flavoprotein alpha subunit